MVETAWVYNRTIQRMRLLSLLSLLLLLLVCGAWEWFLAPLRSGGSWLLLKAVPLMWIVPGILKGRRYTYQYSSMLILFYFAEGVMRLFDADVLSRICAAAEVSLSTVFFVACLGFCKATRSLA